ncbi:MAG: carbohydrate kinase [bacterium]|nr:carbohydrate kinase [bacterium]
MSPSPPIGPIIFGEVLFDVFPDRSRVLGGAPFNVAWHLQAFGCHPLFISCVGCDAPGDEILARMRTWGMRTDGISRAPHRPTGTVTVALHDGQPTFTINPDQAYDELALPPFDLASSPLLYCGSLCLRTAHARAQFSLLCQRTHAPLFVDINLRHPWWQPALVAHLLSQAAWFKCNAQELHEIASAFNISAPTDDLLAAALLSRFPLRALIVTYGEHGAVWYDPNGTRLSHAPPPVSPFIDTVGAGDAFSAVVIYGLLKQLTPDSILARAVAFAAQICSIRGAVPTSRTFYLNFLSNSPDAC